MPPRRPLANQRCPLLRALSGERGGLQVRLRSQIIPRASTAANLGVSSARGLSPNRRPRKAGF
jgi:hypothetical protein